MYISPESELGKELSKWDTPKRLGGMGPNGYEPYPRMLYKAFQRDNGKVLCMEPPPSPYLFSTAEAHERACMLAEGFTKQCQRTVESELEEERAKAEGWRNSPQDALEHYEALQRAIGDAAAEANFAAQRMTPKAQAERKAREAATDKHVSE
jgi:hypothetical protein